MSSLRAAPYRIVIEDAGNHDCPANGTCHRCGNLERGLKRVRAIGPSGYVATTSLPLEAGYCFDCAEIVARTAQNDKLTPRMAVRQLLEKHFPPDRGVRQQELEEGIMEIIRDVMRGSR